MTTISSKRLEAKNALESNIRSYLQEFFHDAFAEPPKELYKTLLMPFEEALLLFVLKKANWNQSRAAEWLGLSRGTLRTRLKLLESY